MSEKRVKVGVLIPMKESIEDGLSRQELTIFEGPNIIGRKDLPMLDKQVSRKHVRLDGLRDGTVKAFAEGQNPINVISESSKRRLPSKEGVILRDGDIIELIPGKLHFMFNMSSEKEEGARHMHNESLNSKLSAGREIKSFAANVVGNNNVEMAASTNTFAEDKNSLLKRKQQIVDDESFARKLQAIEDERINGTTERQFANNTEGTYRHSGGSSQHFNITKELSSSTFRLLHVNSLPKWANTESVTITDVIKGNILVAILSNYMVDIDWLLSACPKLRTFSRVVVIHGESGMRVDYLNKEKPSNWFLHKPPLRLSYGTHHSKAMVLVYPTGVRVVVHTANLIYVDWNNKTQGLWMQDFPYKDETDIKQTSAFEDDLIDYLEALEWPGIDATLPNVGDVKINAAFFRRFDYSRATVRLVGSVPGYHQGPKVKKWGHMKLKSILQEQTFEEEFKGSALVYQFSSLGSLDEKWMSELQSSMCSGLTQNKQPLGLGAIQIIWPTVEDVRSSIEGYAAGNAIPSPLKNVEKPFLKKYWCRWQADHTGRTCAMPHIKTFARYNDQSLAWFLLTSANLSKAAWGTLQKNGSQLMIRSYELGVIFLPSVVLNKGRGFSCTDDSDFQQKMSVDAKGHAKLVTTCWQGEQNDGTSHKILKLPVPFRLPPQPYRSDDVPWSWDRKYNKPDVYGEVWPHPVKLYTSG